MKKARSRAGYIAILTVILLLITSCGNNTGKLELDIPPIFAESLEGEELDQARQMAGWQLDPTGTFAYLEYIPHGSTVPYFDETYDYNDSYFIYETTVNGEKMYGYMDTGFNRISEPVSQWPCVFMYNLAYARVNNQSTAIDKSFLEVDTYLNNFVKKGDTLIQVMWTNEPDDSPYFVDEIDFDKYLVPVMQTNNMETGRTVDGVIWGYKTFNDAYIGDPNGETEFKIEPMFEQAAGFFDGLAAVKMNDKWGYIDEEGDIIVEFIYDRATSLRNGIAMVLKEETDSDGDTTSGFWALIDSQGNLLTDFDYTAIGQFEDGVAIAVTQYNTTSNRGVRTRIYQTYLRSDGKELMLSTSNTAELMPFNEGKAVVRDSNAYIYINNEGETVVPGRYYSAQNFSDGYAAVKKSRTSMRWGYITENGTMAIDATYIIANPFDDGFAYVRDSLSQNGFLIDKAEKKYLTELQLSGISKFNSDGYALAYSDITTMQTMTNADTGESWEEEVQETRYYMIHIE